MTNKKIYYIIEATNIEKLKITELHVFPFSPREGTPAATMKNQVDGNIKKERVKKLRIEFQVLY